MRLAGFCKSKTVAIITTVAALSLSSLGVDDASAAGPAAPPPAGYPVASIVGNAHNAKFGTIPIRRGYYDADANKGFGWDKIWNKHRITTISAAQVVMGSTNATLQGNSNWLLKTYTGYYRCSGAVCTLVKQQEVNGVYAPNANVYIGGFYISGVIGALTAYCVNDVRSNDCAPWVTYGIDHPGKPNPYLPNASAAIKTNDGASEVPVTSYKVLPRTITATIAKKASLLR